MAVPGAELIVGVPRLGGLALAGVGLGVTVAGSSQFQRAATNIKTFDDPNQLVTSGLFAWSRNPMYLGFTCALAGIAIVLGTATPWLGPVGFAVVADRIYVRFEEQRMAAVFGPEFERYRSRVNRWLGRPMRSARSEKEHRVA